MWFSFRLDGMFPNVELQIENFLSYTTTEQIVYGLAFISMYIIIFFFFFKYNEILHHRTTHVQRIEDKSK